MATIFWFLYMGCRLAPTGKYDITVHVRRRCGLISNYFDHLLLLPSRPQTGIKRKHPSVLNTSSSVAKLPASNAAPPDLASHRIGQIAMSTGVSSPSSMTSVYHSLLAQVTHYVSVARPVYDILM